MLDNRYALLFIRGERPIMDFKFDLVSHPNIRLTADGGKQFFSHGNTENAVAGLVFSEDIPKDAEKLEFVETSYELLCEEELEEIFNI